MIEDKSEGGQTMAEKKFMPYKEGMFIALDGPEYGEAAEGCALSECGAMYRYKTGKNTEIQEIVPEDDKKILFGIRPCDVRSIDLMDKVFLTISYVDSYYAKRRENVTVVAFGCTEPERTCFCESMGLDPNNAPSADVMMNVAKGSGGNSYVLEAYTDKGKELLKQLKPLESGSGEPLRDTRCTLQINKAEDLDKKLADMFEHPIWDKITEGCIGCGTCTFICPTCYCFDIDHENYGAEGCKYRCWDSCMFSDYTRMAGAIKTDQKERLRNRYLHKLSYFNERYGETLCVGCGRCVAACPSHLDITEFIEKATLADPKAKTYTDAPAERRHKKWQQIMSAHAIQTPWFHLCVRLLK